MLATPHMLVGAALGKALRRPWLALPAALLSHLVLDWVPHLDTHAMFGAGYSSPPPKEIIAGSVDSVVGIGLVLWLAWRQPHRGVILGAAFCGIVWDLVFNVPPWGAWFRTWHGMTWLATFHHGIQHNLVPSQWPLGLGTQAVAIALALWALLPRGRPAAPEPAGNEEE